MACVSSFVLREVPLWMSTLWDLLQYEQITTYCVPHALFRSFFPCLQLLSHFPVFPSGIAQCMRSRIYSSQSHWPLKLQTLSTTGCQKSGHLAPLAVQANCYGDSFFLCAPVSVVCLLSFSVIATPCPPTAALILFSPKPCLCTFYLLSCGLFCSISCRICSV